MVVPRTGGGGALIGGASLYRRRYLHYHRTNELDN